MLTTTNINFPLFEILNGTAEEINKHTKKRETMNVEKYLLYLLKIKHTMSTKNKPNKMFRKFECEFYDATAQVAHCQLK